MATKFKYLQLIKNLSIPFGLIIFFSIILMLYYKYSIDDHTIIAIFLGLSMKEFFSALFIRSLYVESIEINNSKVMLNTVSDVGVLNKIEIDLNDIIDLNFKIKNWHTYNYNFFRVELIIKNTDISDKKYKIYFVLKDDIFSFIRHWKNNCA